MGFNIGDPIFSEKGFPGVVTGRNPKTASLVVDTNTKAVSGETRHGFLVGMEPELRDEFNGIMDKIVAMASPMEKLEQLQGKIQEIQLGEPSLHSLRLMRYLKAEMFHIMSTYQVTPRHYEIAPE